MTPFAEMLKIDELRAGMFRSLGCDPGDSAEEAAVNMVIAWPKLAALWPSGVPGSETVALGLIGGIPPRQFTGMEYPPLLAAVRWCLMTQGCSAVHFQPRKDTFYLGGSKAGEYQNIEVQLFHDDGLPDGGLIAARDRMEFVLQSSIGCGFFDLPSLSTDIIPYMGGEWKRTYQVAWHLPTDRMSTSLTVAKNDGRTRERHCFELSSSSAEHLHRLIILVSPLTGGEHSRHAL